MSRFGAWYKTCPLWQYVLAQTVISGVVFGALEVILHGSGAVVGPVSIWFFITYVVFMALANAWAGKRRRNGTA